MKATIVLPWTVLAFGLAVILNACGGGASSTNVTGNITVSVSSDAKSLVATKTATVSATVTGDSSGQGVSWTVSCGALQCGSIIPNPVDGSTTFTATYTAPSAPAANLPVSIKATSVAENTQSDSTIITVLAITVAVSSSATTVQVGAGNVARISATVNNDSSSMGVKFTVSPASQAGDLKQQDPFNAIYNAPGTPPSSNLTVTVTGTSVTDPTKSANVSITVPNVAVSVTPSNASLVTGQYQTFTATVVGSTNSAVTWQVNGVPGGNSVSGTISSGGFYRPPNQPPVKGAVTVTAVSSAEPLAFGNATVTVETPLPSSTATSFFGMHINGGNTPWPTDLSVPFGAWRSHDSGGTRWSEINTAPGAYDWSSLDEWMTLAQQNGQDVLYNFYSTPTWAASDPTQSCVASALFGKGTCTPPDDLNPDGTGTDQHVMDFTTALMNHVGPGKIKFIEIWNEPNNSGEWTGTQAQIVRMTQDIRAVAESIDPNVLICAPPETGDGTANEQMNWLAAFLAAGGGALVDVITLHGHVPGDSPESIAPRIENTRSVMALYGQSGKPIFDTEGSWSAGLPSPVDEVAFTGRHYLLQIAEGIQRFYLYAFDIGDDGNLYDLNTQTLTPNATAYDQIYTWTTGAIASGPCSANGTVWTCGFSRSNNYQAIAVWDTSANCFNCTTMMYNAPAQFKQYRDLSGNLTTISGSQVPIGPRPILLETGSFN